MNKSIERATRVIALTTAIPAGTAQTAGAETAAPMSPRQAQATRLAAKITHELYDTKDFPNGVPVPGILNGTVEIDEPSIHNKVMFRNPVILEAGHTIAQIDKNNKLINNTWIGIPVSNADGQISISPVEINIGNQPVNGASQNGEIMSVHLQKNQDAVLEGAGIYISPQSSNSNPEFIGFDIQGGGKPYPEVRIAADGMR